MSQNDEEEVRWIEVKFVFLQYTEWLFVNQGDLKHGKVRTEEIPKWGELQTYVVSALTSCKTEALIGAEASMKRDLCSNDDDEWRDFTRETGDHTQVYIDGEYSHG